MTQILGLTFETDFRAHPDGFYQLKSGSWRRIEEFQETTMRKMTKVLGIVEHIFLHLANGVVPMVWLDVFNSLKDIDLQAGGLQAQLHTLLLKKQKPCWKAVLTKMYTKF